MFRRTLSLLAVCAAFSAAFIGAPVYADYNQDHPLFSAYPGAHLERAKMYDYEKFSFPVSVMDISKKPYTFTRLDAVGDLYLYNYEIKNASSFKVYKNYIAAANKLNFKPVFFCELEACGDVNQVKALGSFIAITKNVFNNYHKPYYWVGEKESTKGKIVVAWFFGAYEDQVNVQQVIVETEPLEIGLVKVDTAYAGQAPIIIKPLSEDGKAKDNAILPRYPGAKIDFLKKVDTETIKLPLAVNSAEKTPLELTGDLTKHTYTIDNVSTLKVYENYKSALTNAGFDFISQCELVQCGTSKQAKDLGGQLAVSGNVYNSYRNPYYLLAKKTLPAGNVFISLFIGAYESQVNVQQVILQEKSVQTGLVIVNADSLQQQIDAEGKALIYGIYFDTGKSEIKAESKLTLDAIAELLTRSPNLLLYVVGHTDDTGDGVANVNLSKQRADSVVAVLVNNYQVAASRLQAQGVGPYAPASNNTSDTGKQKNRRVELVKRLR